MDCSGFSPLQVELIEFGVMAMGVLPAAVAGLVVFFGVERGLDARYGPVRYGRKSDNRRRVYGFASGLAGLFAFSVILVEILTSSLADRLICLP